MRAKLAKIVFAAIVVASIFFVLVEVSSSAEYDPWIDSNDDGEIDIFDAINLAAAFGTSGTPINKTALLLELQARIDDLNATVVALEQRVSDLEGQPSEKTLAHAAIVGTSTDGVGNVNINYPVGRFTTTPSLSVTAQFNSGGTAQMGYVTVSGHSSSGFTLNVKDGNGSNWSGSVQISYVAIQE